MTSVQKTNIHTKNTGWVEKLFVGILLVVFGGIVLHAPFSVGFGVLFPEYDLFIKSWKEILLGVALALAVYIVAKRRAWALFNTWIVWLIGGFAALNLLLIPVFYTGFDATIAGLFINLRYLLFFILVYVAITLYPQYYKLFIKVFIAGAIVVIGFALLQLTILPHDILKYIGYSTQTIVPYLTVDENMDYIRINSTLRGPNPLGAYAVIAGAMMLALLVSGARKPTKQMAWGLLALGVGSAIVLWASYSRSAALAALVAVGIVLLVTFHGKIHKAVWIAVGISVLLLSGGIYAFKDTQFVSQVILHEDPHEGNDANSNDGHAESLATGTERMVRQPLGAGVGSTGSASLFTDNPFIIENQYLFIAHEAGWLGLVLFVVLYWFVLRQLWRRRTHWLALGVFASGIGLAIIGVLLPVFVDDTVSIIWWGLAAIALAMNVHTPLKKEAKKVN